MVDGESIEENDGLRNAQEVNVVYERMQEIGSRDEERQVEKSDQ